MGVTSQENPKGGTRLVQIGNLKAATRYRFEVRDTNGKNVSNGEGSFVTQRAGTVPFRFLAMTDAHVNPLNPERNIVLRTCADAAARLRPDFVFHMGDNIQTVASSHGGPASSGRTSVHLLSLLASGHGKAAGRDSEFVLNGNWEGENGWHPELNRKWARDARMLFAPAPDGATYPQGGSPHEDYYAFTWGNALFVTLNATGYNVINHEHTLGPGRGDDWTLGKEQYAWLEKTLRESGEPWKFLFIHHAVGGNAGDDVNTRYGRGAAGPLMWVNRLRFMKCEKNMACRSFSTRTIMYSPIWRWMASIISVTVQSALRGSSVQKKQDMSFIFRIPVLPWWM